MIEYKHKPMDNVRAQQFVYPNKIPPMVYGIEKNDGKRAIAKFTDNLGFVNEIKDRQWIVTFDKCKNPFYFVMDNDEFQRTYELASCD